jgi:hypothetical protein
MIKHFLIVPMPNDTTNKVTYFLLMVIDYDGNECAYAYDSNQYMSYDEAASLKETFEGLPVINMADWTEVLETSFRI